MTAYKFEALEEAQNTSSNAKAVKILQYSRNRSKDKAREFDGLKREQSANKARTNTERTPKKNTLTETNTEAGQKQGITKGS